MFYQNSFCVAEQAWVQMYAKHSGGKVNRIFIPSSLKEADESAYWLELLHESGYLTEEQFHSLIEDCNEIIALLVSITKKQKEVNRDE